MLKMMLNGFFKHPPVSKINLKSLPHLKYNEPYERVSKQLSSEIITYGPERVRATIQQEAEILKVVEAELDKKKQEFDDNIGEPSFQRVKEGYSLEGFKEKERDIFVEELKELQQVKDGLKSRQIESKKLLPPSPGFFSWWASSKREAEAETETALVLPPRGKC